MSYSEKYYSLDCLDHVSSFLDNVDVHGVLEYFGEKFAKSVTGNDAIVSGDEVLWKEGAKDRRKCVPRAGTSESGCDQKARYGDYIILGDMIILCEGLSSEEAMSLCYEFKESLIEN